MSSDAGAAEAAAGAGSAAAGDSAGAAGSGSAVAPFYESFADAELKTNPSIVQNFKTPEDLAKAYVNLEKRFGIDPNRRVDLPTDLNDKDGMRAVYAKLGLPENADGYGLQLAADASEADKAFLTDALTSFHEIGLPAGMAKGVFEFWMKKVGEANTAAEAQGQELIRTGKDALQKDFGGAFDSRVKEIRGLIAKEGGEELAKAFEGDALFRYPQLAKMLGKVLDRMAEPGAPGGQSGDAYTGERALTPTQASAALRVLEADPVKSKALMDGSHPMHRAVLDERRRLLELRDGRTPA